jgi:murein DD-endopeptidase MepM/ murein hydrolase activator NlpD
VRGANAGRFIRIGHKEGSVVSRYIHLDTIREDLREGARVHGGEVIGRLGRTGVEHSGAHLHFSVSLRAGGRGGDERYIDPEPMLRDWTLPSLPAVASYTPR